MGSRIKDKKHNGGHAGRRIGYARVSTEEQTLDPQTLALRAAGCAPIFTDHGVPGAARRRPGLAAALAALEPDDVLVVWRLDRLGRSLAHLIAVVNALAARGVGFRSLTEAIDTTTPGGRLIFHVMGALAEFERAVIAERTRAGLAAARARGVALGRPRLLSAADVARARRLIERGETRTAVARRLKISGTTLRRALGRSGGRARSDGPRSQGARRRVLARRAV